MKTLKVNKINLNSLRRLLDLGYVVIISSTIKEN